MSAKNILFWNVARGNNVALVAALCGDDEVDVNFSFNELGWTTLTVSCFRGFVGCTPFFGACQVGRTEVVKLLMKDPRIDINKPTHDGLTPLFVACTGKHKEVIRLLLDDERTDINRGQSEGANPFFVACQGCDAEVVGWFLSDPRVTVTIRTRVSNFSPFLVACQCGTAETVKLLLSDPRINLLSTSANGASPFLAACQHGREDVVSLLLADLRVDVISPQNEGVTPLWIAAHHGHDKIVDLLLTSGRVNDANTRSADGPDGWNGKSVSEITVSDAFHHFFTEMRASITTRRNAVGQEISDKVRRFSEDPASEISRLQSRPQHRDAFIGSMFGVLIFLSDRFFLLKSAKEMEPEPENRKKIWRFLAIALALPMELQMMMCNRIYGSSKDLVLTKQSEPAFKALAKEFIQW